jgi:hypothetical protein
MSHVRYRRKSPPQFLNLSCNSMVHEASIDTEFNEKQRERENDQGWYRYEAEPRCNNANDKLPS